MDNAVTSYKQRYPYVSDRACIPTENGLLSVAESNALKRRYTDRLLELVAQAERSDKRAFYYPQIIQLSFHVFSSAISFDRYLAFDRVSGCPLIAEKKESLFWATPLTYAAYSTLLKGLEALTDFPHTPCAFTLTFFHDTSFGELLKIGCFENLHHVLPLRAYEPPERIAADDTLYDTTVDDMLTSPSLYAVLQREEYTVKQPLSVSSFEDYVVSLEDACGRRRLADVRELSDIYEKTWFITVADRRVPVILIGTTSVIIPFTPSADYTSRGFRRLDPRDMGPGWEVPVSCIHAVHYRKTSLYEAVCRRLQR